MRFLNFQFHQYDSPMQPLTPHIHSCWHPAFFPVPIEGYSPIQWGSAHIFFGIQCCKLLRSHYLFAYLTDHHIHWDIHRGLCDAAHSALNLTSAYQQWLQYFSRNPALLFNASPWKRLKRFRMAMCKEVSSDNDERICRRKMIKSATEDQATVTKV